MTSAPVPPPPGALLRAAPSGMPKVYAGGMTTAAAGRTARVAPARRLGLAVFLLALLALLPSSPIGPPRARAQTAGGPPRRVLALFPTEPGDPIAVLLEQGLRDGLKAAGGGGAGAAPSRCSPSTWR